MPLLCPRCEQPIAPSCECRSWTRRRFFAGLSVGLGGLLVAPKLALSTLSEPSSAIVVPPYTTNADILFDPPEERSRWGGSGVFWDVQIARPATNHLAMPRVVRDYRCPRGSFAAFERFVEKHYAVS